MTASRRYDSRSNQALAYRKLYQTARWQALRLQALQAEPLCRFCAKAGRVTPATVVDHIKDHKGNEALFFAQDNHQPLCKPCHDSAKRTGRICVGVDGWPVEV